MSKEKGDEVELLFKLRAHQVGLTVAEPYGDRRPYDFIVESRSNTLYKIQVKCCEGASKMLGKLDKYKKGDFDFLFVLTGGYFLVIPFEVIENKRTIRMSEKLISEWVEKWEQII